jgi:hypothetical protein
MGAFYPFLVLCSDVTWRLFDGYISIAMKLRPLVERSLAVLHPVSIWILLKQVILE